MPARLACLLLILAVATTAATPQSSAPAAIQSRIERKIDWHNDMASATPTPAELDANVARLQSMHHDAEELAELNASLQSDLLRLRKGLMAKDLVEKLKKVEKLSKKLRRDMEP